MKTLNNYEIQLISGGGFWSGFCTGFALGNVGIAIAGITLGPAGAAAYTSVMAGCAIHTIIEQISD